MYDLCWQKLFIVFIGEISSCIKIHKSIGRRTLGLIVQVEILTNRTHLAVDHLKNQVETILYWIGNHFNSSQSVVHHFLIDVTTFYGWLTRASKQKSMGKNHISFYPSLQYYIHWYCIVEILSTKTTRRLLSKVSLKL